MFHSPAGFRSVALFLLLLLSSAISRAQTQNLFFQPPSFGCPSPQVTADFNQDGILDLACSSGEVWFGSADGTFHSIILAGAGGQSVATADFNGDGKPDIAFSSFQSTNLTVSLSNGDGTFQTAINTNVGISVLPIAAADLNGDGKPDVVGISAYPSGLFEFFGRGDGTFADPVQIPVKGFNSLPTLILGDVNGDGKVDIILGGAIGNQYVIGVLLGNGDGTFQSPVVTSVQVAPWEMVKGDFNNDGKLDLVIPGSSGPPASGTSLLLGNGDGTFQSPLLIEPFGGTLGVGDFNGDGNLDLAIAASFETILLGNGDGTFTWVATYLGDGASTAGDFNGDGKLDLATGGTVLLGNGDGTFQGNPAVNVAGSVLFAGVTGDFNGDGIPDVAVTDGGSIYILLSGGTGKFRVANVYSGGGYGIATSDLNSDGKLDLVIISSFNLNVLLGNGDGSFGSPISFPLGGAINSDQIEISDFNGDHKPDVAVLSNGDLAVLVGNGDGTFASPVNYFAGSDPSSLAVADFNSDGKVDVAVSSSAGFGMLFGNGDGTFQSVIFSNQSVFGLSTVADLNNDGNADLVFDGARYVALGKGNGTFANPLFTGAYPGGSVAVADENGDGRLDFVTAFPSNPVDVLLGNGDGTFGSPIAVVSLNGTTNFVLAADFNRDGKPDLALPVDGGLVTFLNVTQPGFTLAASPLSPATVTAGEPATSMVTVGRTWGFTGSVSFSCSKLPSGASCSFNPASVAGASGASGTSALTISTSATTAPGTYPVNVNGASGPLQHSAPLSLVVQQAPGFTISGTALSPSSVSPGGSATSTITVTAMGGFNQSATLSCSSITLNGSAATTAPPTCSFNPASVMNGSGTSTLTVSTTASSALLTLPAMRRSRLFYALWLPIGGMALMGAGFSSGSRRRKLLEMLSVCVILSGLVFLAACGGSGSSSNGGGGGGGSTPAGTYTVTVKAAAGSTVNTATVTLTVQ